MTICNILKKHPEKIRRKSWRGYKGLHLVIKHNNIALYITFGKSDELKRWNPKPDDLLAYDWEIYDK